MPRRKSSSPVRIPGRAVGYIRVSTSTQVEEGFSLDAQRRKIEAYCMARGWDLVTTYSDEGISATKRRPGFEQMVIDVLADGVSHVVALKLDRLGRSAVDLLNLYQSLEDKGVALVTIEDSIDTSTAHGRMLRTILAAVSEFERELISERVKIGMAEAKVQGVHLGRRSTLPGEIRARMVSMRAGGQTLTQIAETLNGEKVPTATGAGTWHANTVRRYLA